VPTAVGASFSAGKCNSRRVFRLPWHCCFRRAAIQPWASPVEQGTLPSTLIGSGLTMKNSLKGSVLLLALVLKPIAMGAGAASGSAQAQLSSVDVRFYPDSIYSYPLDSVRGWYLALLQNSAVIWRGEQPLVLTGVELELLSGNDLLEVRPLTAPELAKIAARGQRLAASGMLSAVKFQFDGEGLLPADVRLAKEATLAKGEALLVAQQLFAYRGDATAIRVRVRGSAGGSAVEGSGSISIRKAEGKTAFRFPLKGRWYIGAGASLHSHHRWGVPEEFALDIVKLGIDGATYKGKGTRRSEYFAYGAPVLAAASGRVVVAVSDELETDADLRQPGEAADAYLARVTKSQGERLARGSRGIAGNHVVIAHAERQFSVYAHLKPGSLKVKVGDTVNAGQTVGQLGTSGNSTEPHLHFHVCDQPDPLMCAGIPIDFTNVELPGELMPRLLQTGDIVVASD